MAEQDTAGVEDIRHLLNRFPEDETTVRDLIQRDPTFAALCREYHQTEEEIQRLRERLLEAGLTRRSARGCAVYPQR
jgi:hypothetical protein